MIDKWWLDKRPVIIIHHFGIKWCNLSVEALPLSYGCVYIACACSSISPCSFPSRMLQTSLRCMHTFMCVSVRQSVWPHIVLVGPSDVSFSSSRLSQSEATSLFRVYKFKIRWTLRCVTPSKAIKAARSLTSVRAKAETWNSTWNRGAYPSPFNPLPVLMSSKKKQESGQVHFRWNSAHGFCPTVLPAVLLPAICDLPSNRTPHLSHSWLCRSPITLKSVACKIFWLILNSHL